MNRTTCICHWNGILEGEKYIGGRKVAVPADANSTYTSFCETICECLSIDVNHKVFEYSTEAAREIILELSNDANLKSMIACNNGLAMVYIKEGDVEEGIEANDGASLSTAAEIPNSEDVTTGDDGASSSTAAEIPNSEDVKTGDDDGASSSAAAEIPNSEDVTTGEDGASSSTTASGSTYEVFLSFRGADIRLGFTDHLYCNLTGAGVETFRDNEKLHVGEEIGPDLMKAIEQSSISIPIFSKDYASSKWCLRELARMVRCMNDKDPEGRPRHTICPIFYNVTPEVVKRQTGSFAEAFEKHANDKKLDPSTVKEWKDALKKVCELKGWEKDKIADKHEGQLVDVIVKEVCMMLKKRNVHLTGDLVGKEHHWEEMTKLLDMYSDNGARIVRIVGIIGMGGIGKTTIAKYTYNQLCDHFQQQCSFLEDVRENVMHKGCAELQQKLISDVLKRSADKTTLDIRNAFIHKKVLIVLDDVEDKSQLEDIIGGLEYFGSGSRIIVTTRNKEVFEECDRDLIYAPSEMKFDDSMLLFCKSAFRSAQPREGFEDISREVVQTAAGLPLSLVIIGSMLFLKKRKVWKATLEKLKTIPADDVQKRLKISYDTLEPNQQQMFLDIACHFTEQDKTNPIYMWEACGLFPKGCEGIDVLVSLSLITIEKLLVKGRDMDVFRMHDHLRDLGRYIVFQESSSDPGQRSRLWSEEEAREVLDDQLGTEKVEIFSMNNYFRRYSDYSNDDFKEMSRLRYLSLVGAGLRGNFKGLVSNLRWFSWHTYPNFEGIPITNFCPRKLVVLDLSGSGISDGWESAIQIESATNLKVLDISYCSRLTKLPECLWNMKSLVKLDLSSTEIAELSEQGIGNLTNLTKLFLRQSRIERLPDAIGNLEKLEELDCFRCLYLKGEVSSGIGRLTSLRVLDLSRTGIDTLPEDVGSLCNLRKLNLSRNFQLEKLWGVGIERLQKLEELNCSGCKSLERQLPEGIWRLSSLRVLDLTYTKITGGLPNDISGLSKLEILNLGDCENLQLPVEELKLPSSLTRLDIPLTEVSVNGVRGLVNLRELEFHTNDGYCCEPVAEEEEVGRIDMPNNLEGLWLIGLDDHVMSCRPLRSMKFDSSSRLNSLHIDSCTMEGLPPLDLSVCQTVKKLTIYSCPHMWSIWGIENFTSLKELTVVDCPHLKRTDLPILESLENIDWEEDLLRPIGVDHHQICRI